MGAKKKAGKQKSFPFAKGVQELFTAADAPQADNPSRIRSLVAAVDAGVTTRQGFIDATGFTDRHVQYNRHAAQVLELIEEKNGFVVTPHGAALLSTAADSAEERAAFREALLKARRMSPFRDVFEGETEPTKEELGYRIGVRTKLAKNTAERRAGCLIAWRRFVRGPHASSTAVESHAEIAKQIHEQIEAQNAKAREDYLKQLQNMKPLLFEKIVAQLIEKMGYTNVKHVGGPGDGGVDVRALHVDSWDKQHHVAIQANRYRKTVGRRFVHELIGVMHGENCDEALLVTTGVFGPDAMQAAASKQTLTLVDGPALVQRLIKYEIGMRRDEHGAIVPVVVAAGKNAKQS